jgi:hypothetical protein
VSYVLASIITRTNVLIKESHERSLTLLLLYFPCLLRRKIVRTKLYDKRGKFQFFHRELSIKMYHLPSYGVYSSQLIRYSKEAAEVITLTLRRKIVRTTLCDKRWFQFSHCELSFYMLQHSSSTFMWNIYLSVNQIFQGSFWSHQFESCSVATMTWLTVT